MPKRVLVTWIGHADLIAYSRFGCPSKKDMELIHKAVSSSKVRPTLVTSLKRLPLRSKVLGDDRNYVCPV